MPLRQMQELNLSNKTVLIREDLNVPMQNGEIVSTKRIAAILPTLDLALKQQAKVILLSHLGRPQAGEFDPTFSLSPVADCLSHMLGRPVHFASTLDATKEIGFGEVCLLENVRFLTGEKENDPKLSKELAELGDIFVMDAFATAHRKEASTYGVAKYAEVACAGPLLMSEIHALDKIMEDPARPLVAIVGGLKVSTKLSILKNLLSKVDYLIVGGGIANTFLAAGGFAIGRSLYEKNLLQEAKDMLTYAKATHKRIPLPLDVVVAQDFASQAEAQIKLIEEVSPSDLILDVGPKTRLQFTEIIKKAKTILWNGPLGVFEWDQFGEGTKALAEAIATSTAFSVAGGGDTVAAIEKYQVEKEISYISTAGGAFLEFLEGKSLPAITILTTK